MTNLTPLLAAVVPSGAGDTDAVATTTDWVLLFLYLALALGVSFLCSLLEAGILSVPQSHVELLAKEGKASGKRLKRMKANIDRPLAAILTLNTIAHTVGAAGVGAQILVIFGSGSVAIGSAIVTLLILVFSEIIPKSLGAAHAKGLAPLNSLLIQIMIWGTLPLLIPLQWISGFFGGGHNVAVTRDEVAITADLGLSAGVLDHGESRVIRNLLRLSQVRVHDIMTPRPVMFTLPQDQTVAQVMDRHGRLRFSRIPIHAGDNDRITGFVTRHKILTAHGLDQHDLPLSALADSLEAVPEDMNVAELLNRMVKQQEHLLLVKDEFDGTAGVVTLEDCIETLLGVEIVDETDTVEDMRQTARALNERRREEHDADASKLADS